MYTVVRFTSSTATREVHEAIGSELNVLIAGVYSGLRPAGDGFGCELSDVGGWEVHRVGILEFIRAAGAPISRAQQQDVNVCVDVALEPEDFAGTIVFTIHADPELTGCLARAGVSIEFSVYGYEPVDEDVTP